MRYAPKPIVGLTVSLDDEERRETMDPCLSHYISIPRVGVTGWCGEWMAKEVKIETKDVSLERGWAPYDVEPTTMTRTEIERRNKELPTSVPMTGGMRHDD